MKKVTFLPYSITLYCFELMYPKILRLPAPLIKPFVRKACHMALPTWPQLTESQVGPHIHHNWALGCKQNQLLTYQKRFLQGIDIGKLIELIRSLKNHL